MRMVLEISRLLAVPASLEHLLQRIAEGCCKLLDCELASIFLHDPETDELWTMIAMQSKEIRVPKGKGVVGASFGGNTLVHVPRPYEDPRFNPEPDRRSGMVTRSLLACPMPDIDGKPLGVLEGINKRGDAFTENDFGLIQLLAEQAAVALQRHDFQQKALQTVALQREMDLARAVQVSLTPQNPPRGPGLDAVGWTLPASQTGGDCFDIWKTADGRLGVLVADASGHGLGPALIVLQTRTLVRALCNLVSEPHRLLAHVNARLFEDMRNGNFVTAFLGFISSTGLIHWSSAGHGPVFARRGPDEPLMTLDPPALPLGIDDQWPDQVPSPVQLEKMGSLLLVSDGIFEAPNPAKQAFDVSRMRAIFDEHRRSCPAHLLSVLRDAVRVWEQGREPLDDQTIVIVQRDGEGTPG